jgi:N-acetylglucosaminyl-diphospho-decaprenol L-rhamnosyltransferase
MKISYVIITRNRRERLLATLARLEENTPLLQNAWETIVVDNASEDGSVAAVRSAFPDVRTIGLTSNEGMPARNHAFAQARGEFLISLDDDSYPAPGAIEIALKYLASRPLTAALTARAVLPDGKWEASAFPRVILGGACVLRRSAILKVGGFPAEFFRQAEEYDLSFRLWKAGYTVEREEALIFRHDKSPGGRSSALTHQMDLRNNLILVERYLPASLRSEYRHDWIRRYCAIARNDGCEIAMADALRDARQWAKRERATGRQTLPPLLVEKLFDLEKQGDLVRQWKRQHAIRRVAIADFSKNYFATWRACTLAGLEIAALADDRAAFAGMSHRGVPIVPISQTVRRSIDGIVLSNINPAQIDDRLDDLRNAFPGPILRLWNPKPAAGVADAGGSPNAGVRDPGYSERSRRTLAA